MLALWKADHPHNVLECKRAMLATTYYRQGRQKAVLRQVVCHAASLGPQSRSSAENIGHHANLEGFGL
jgi:hypothetical protein